VKLKLDEHTK